MRAKVSARRGRRWPRIAGLVGPPWAWRRVSRSSKMLPGSCELSSRNRPRFLAMGHLFPQRAVADQFAYLAPHRLPLGIRGPDIAKAMRPAYYRLDFHLEGHTAGDQPTRLSHDLCHA